MASLNEITDSLSVHYKNAEEAKNIIIRSAITAAAADAVGSIIPGLAIVTTIIGCFGVVWVMYARISSMLGISLKEKTLKIIGRAALANISANLVAAILALLVPGVSIVASAVVTFITVYIAGKIFMSLILDMVQTSSDSKSFSDISVNEMKSRVRNAQISATDVEEAKEVHEKNHNSIAP